jgi:hypothetical protein
VSLKKVCTLSFALKPCYSFTHLATLPAYIKLTTTILFHSNLFFGPYPGNTAFSNYSGNHENISHVRRVSSVEWTLVILAGTHPKSPLFFLESNSWTPSVFMASSPSSVYLLSMSL